MLLKVIGGKNELNQLFNKDVQFINTLNQEERNKLMLEIRKGNIEVELESIFDNEIDNYIYTKDEGFSFVFDDAIKKIFMLNAQEGDETDYRKRRDFTNLVAIEEFEVQINKSAFDLNNEEISHLINYLQKELHNKHTTIKYKLYTVHKIMRNHGVQMNGDWGISVNEVSEEMGRYSSFSKVITKNSLKEVFWDMPNPQVAIIPILLFEGVVLSSNDELDEIRSLKTANVLDTGVFVESKKYGKRFIEMDENTIKMIRFASKQKRIVIDSPIRKEDRAKFEFMSSEYVLKIIELAMARNVDGRISFPGIRRRVKEFQEYFKDEYGLSNVGSRMLRDCGKIHYAKKYMLEGLPFKNASIKSLERYGEYEKFNVDKTVISMKRSNDTRYYKFKKTWEAYNANWNWNGDRP